MILRNVIAVVCLLLSSYTVAHAAEEPGECSREEVCAAWASTARNKVFARCGTNYSCTCEKTNRECESGILGGKKAWFSCDCKRKPRCDIEVCAVYQTTATGKADVACERTGCRCEKTDKKCDTSFTGKDKYTFTCVCD
jgi:hypothetical protein